MAHFSDRIALGNALHSLLTCEEILVGDQAGYEICKQIYLYHPHGSKIVDRPLELATSKDREITVPGTPGDGTDLIEAFKKQWDDDKCTEHLINVGRLARIYGPATLAVVEKDGDSEKPLDTGNLSKAEISYNELDPLNTSGSLVMNQDPNALDFQKHSGVRVNGKNYDRSRVVVLQHERPIYIAYESSGYGFTGRSAYQRALLPLKQYIQLMQANGMVALKAAVLIAKVKQPSSAVDRPMLGFLRQKREFVKEAQNGNVISIDTEEEIDTLNFQNLEGPLTAVRRNIIEDIAAGAGMPAKLLLEDTFATGFGEGTEDSKAIAQYLDGVRTWLKPAYSFLDNLTIHRAWNEEFYAAMQDKYPEQYGEVPYNVAFQNWKNSFKAIWPNLLEQTDEEKADSEKVTLEALVSVFSVLTPELPQDQKARLIDWLANNLNTRTHLFSDPLELDIAAIADYEPPQPQAAPGGFGGDEMDDEVGGQAPGGTPPLKEVSPRAPKVVRLPSL